MRDPFNRQRADYTIPQQVAMASRILADLAVLCDVPEGRMNWLADDVLYFLEEHGATDELTQAFEAAVLEG